MNLPSPDASPLQVEQRPKLKPGEERFLPLKKNREKERQVHFDEVQKALRSIDGLFNSLTP